MLPAEVHEQLIEDLAAYRHGLSPLELHHRSPAGGELAERLQQELRDLLEVPDGYRVLLMSGGASAQFALVALNLAGARSADYLHTGYWSGRALAEARRVARARVAASGAAGDFRELPARARWQLDPRAAYLYYTDNETVEGLEFPAPPVDVAVPLVADMSSNLLSRPLPVARFGLIFAAAQKNLGTPGVTVVIVREELLQRRVATLPSLSDYAVLAEARSLYNTPPVFCWHVSLRVLEWTRRQGGVAALAARNRRKAQRLYATIDASALYQNDVAPACRSRMNVSFRLAAPALQPRLLAAAQQAGLHGLAGHRSRGGLRAALYNAMPEAGVATLIDFLREFERRHG